MTHSASQRTNPSSRRTRCVRSPQCAGPRLLFHPLLRSRRDQLVTLTDAKGNVTTWAYDALGRQTNKLYADSVGDTYRYDALGRLTNHVTGAGHTQTLTYDSRGRLRI